MCIRDRARYAALAAPATASPGSTATVTATLVNDGDYAMPQTQFTLAVPSGWQATLQGTLPGAIEPGQTATAD